MSDMSDRSGPAGRALLVDYGGVLTTNVGDSFREFCRAEGLPGDLVREVFEEAYGSGGEEGPIAALETGRLSPETFGHQLAAALSDRTDLDIDGTDLVRRLFVGMHPDERMLAGVVAARRAGVLTGLLSNSWGDAGYPRERFDELFDVVVISGEVGVRKPSPSIFALAVARTGLEADRCVFVDDMQPNVDAARAAGLVAIRHRDAGETLRKVEEALGLDGGALER